MEPLFMTNNTSYTNIIQQDTILPVKQQPGQSLPFRLLVPVDKPQIDTTRLYNLIEQSEQRELQIIEEQRLSEESAKVKFAPKKRQPSIETDSLMAKYQHIGCSPRANFPDTFSLTALERYYQPMTTGLATDMAKSVFFPEAVDRTYNTKTSDSLSAVAANRVTIAQTRKPAPGFACEDRISNYPSAITFFIMCALVLFAGIKFHFGSNLSQAFQSFFSYRQARRMFEERRESDRQAALYSNILFAFVAGIFISVSLPFFGAEPLWDSFGLSVFFFSLFVGLLYPIKAAVWKVLGVVFMVQPVSDMYVYNMFLYNRNIGLFIFPLVALIPYVTDKLLPCAVYGVLIIFGISYLFKFRRIFQIIRMQNVSVYHFVLYLCTLEILPILLFFKACKVLINF